MSFLSDLAKKFWEKLFRFFAENEEDDFSIILLYFIAEKFCLKSLVQLLFITKPVLKKSSYSAQNNTKSTEQEDILQLQLLFAVADGLIML